jgi:hypothetical protein
MTVPLTTALGPEASNIEDLMSQKEEKKVEG